MAKMAFTGVLKVSGSIHPCTSMASGIKTQPEFYNHIQGLRDTTPGATTKGPGRLNTVQKKIYRWAPKLAISSASGPVVNEVGLSSIMDPAMSGDTIGVSLGNSEGAHDINDAIVSRVSINVSAGDVANWTAEFTGAGLSDSVASGTASCDKLITWDECSISGVDGDVAAFSLSINNPVVPVYTSNGTDLWPDVLRIGIQEVSGSISIYGKPNWDSSETELYIVVGEDDYTVKCVLKPTQIQVNSGGIFISTVDFVGVFSGVGLIT